MFTGFTDETVDFMWGIRFNNERGWFMEHKADYQKYFYEPMKALGADVQAKLLEKFPDSGLCADTEDSVHGWDLGNGGIALGDPVQHHLGSDHAGSCGTPAQGSAGIGGCDALYRSIADDLHITVIAAKDLRGGIPLRGQILAAPLT